MIQPSHSANGGVRWRWVAAGIALALIVAIGVCEVLGWPFLAAPLQRAMSSALERRVVLGAADAGEPVATIRLIGRVSMAADSIEIGAPEWSEAPHMLSASDARLSLGYLDLWRASQGQPIHVRSLRAAELDVQLERLADGRSSWQFGSEKPAPDPERPQAALPGFDELQVGSGTLKYRDEVLAIDMDSTFSLADGENLAALDRPAAAAASDAASDAASNTVAASASQPEGAASAAKAGLQFNATGTYQKQPLRIDLNTPGVLSAIGKDAAEIAVPVTLDARLGRARIAFDGTATDVLKLSALKGRFDISGPSLAAFGDPLQVTLPTTGPFKAGGLIAKEGVVWNTVVERADIGSSRLTAAFTYDPRETRPLLSGRLSGSKLVLADLGPAVGAAAPADKPTKRPKDAARKVLPDREFDLPSLRAMDANVLVDIASLDLGTSLLEPLQPMRTHLVLSDGVLTLRDIDARTAKGRLFGVVTLDGREPVAQWTADLRWRDVRLEHWIRQNRGGGAPPYVTGSLNGQARVAGAGKSTADILGSLHGAVRTQLVGGTLSHLAIEAAGLDVAQALGVLVKGDKALPIECAVSDLKVERGLMRPRVMVIDTSDSTLWVDGLVSLATEALDLTVVVTPKDFSPMALRAPIHVRGRLSDPSVSIDAESAGARLGASALMALLTPIAALIPLIDVSADDDEAKRGAQACRALSQRVSSQASLPPPGVADSRGRKAPPAKNAPKRSER